MEENDVTEDFWEITFYKQREGSVKEEGNELNQLKGSQVPEIEINQILIRDQLNSKYMSIRFSI